MAPAGPTPRSPDGGWGWVVVACSFLALLLGNGPPQAVGILYPEWLLAFGGGKGTTAWVVSLVRSIGFIVGPLCSMCVVNFGARPTVIFGGMMVSGGLMLSAFAPNVHFLIFSYGIMLVCPVPSLKCTWPSLLFSRGEDTSVPMTCLAFLACYFSVGIGLLYTAICTIICVYFDKRRGLALGIISTGSSAGGFLYAILQSKLIQHYGLEGCLLIIGALALNVVACAGTMRPLTSSRSSLKQRAILMQEAEEQHLQDKKEDPSVKDTMELPARSQTLFDCWTFVRMIKMKMGHFLHSYWNLQMVSLVLGFMSGNWTLVTYITSRLVGVEKFPEAYGILLFFGGFGLMLGPPVVGCFHDFAQSYDMAFYLGGSCMIASSFALSFTAILCRRQTPFPLPPPPETEAISCTATTATDATSP